MNSDLSWVIDATASEPITRNGLTCYRAVMPWGPGQQLVWVAAGREGAVTFQMSHTPHPLPGLSVTDAAGRHWQPLVVATHRARPRDAEDETVVGACPYLDNMSCHGDSDGILAIDLVEGLVDHDGDETLIWDMLTVLYGVRVTSEQWQEGSGEARHG